MNANVSFEFAAPSSPLLEELRRWCVSRFERSVLLAGDIGPQLHATSHAVVAVSGGVILGAACRFGGFSIPSVTVSCDDPELVAPLLVRTVTSTSILGISSLQVMPARFRRLPWADDPWLTASCVPNVERDELAIPAEEPEEVARFYDEVGARFWCREMFAPGRVMVSRAGGRIVAAAAVQFVLDEQSYAHIGALATHPMHRSKGLATKLLAAIRGDLALQGVRSCGVFAEGAESWLEMFYRARGFTSRGQSYRFVEFSA